MFSPILSTNFSQFVQLEMKTNLLLVQNSLFLSLPFEKKIITNRYVFEKNCRFRIWNWWNYLMTSSLFLNLEIQRGNNQNFEPKKQCLSAMELALALLKIEIFLPSFLLLQWARILTKTKILTKKSIPMQTKNSSQKIPPKKSSKNIPPKKILKKNPPKKILPKKSSQRNPPKKFFQKIPPKKSSRKISKKFLKKIKIKK